MGRHGRHDSRVAVKNVRGCSAAAGVIQTAKGENPGNIVVVWKAESRGVRSPTMALVRTQASPVSKLKSNWAGVEGEGERNADSRRKQEWRGKN